MYEKAELAPWPISSIRVHAYTSKETESKRDLEELINMNAEATLKENIVSNLNIEYENDFAKANIVKIEEIMNETNLDLYSDKERSIIRDDMVKRLLKECQPEHDDNMWNVKEFYDFLSDEVGNMAEYVLNSLYLSMCAHVHMIFDNKEDTQPFHDMFIRMRVPNANKCSELIWW